MRKSSAWGIYAPLRARLWRQEHGLSGFPSGISPAESASRQRLLLAAKLHEAYNSLQVQLPDLQDAGQSTLTGRSLQERSFGSPQETDEKG